MGPGMETGIIGKIVTPIARMIVPCIFLVANVLAATPVVNIANGPLFNGSGNVHPNMVLSLSVEFPTVGIAYRGDNGTYNKTIEYVGYFNPLKCYTYSDGGYFSIFKAADAKTHECGGDSFSGNFMNWAASSAIDILRYALTGGDRVEDLADSTILQRAMLKESFYAHDVYFPRRSVTAGGNVSAPNQVTPFKTGTLYIVSCRNRILFSDSKSTDGNCDTPAFKGDKKLGEYLVRVKVCDAAEGATRKDLCLKYGNNYKPVGEMQRNSEKIRFAAMGYLLDDAPTRYGGVLRAPMKYVGAKKFEAPDFIEMPNDDVDGVLEWDPATGVFYNNPENPSDRNNTTINSGVINYVNKFGRTNKSEKSGIYKGLDPVGELYYEGIRYLQGKQPTPEATAGMTDAMQDGFSVVQTWKDPVTASCQKNYMVTIADVNTHWDRYIPGNQRTTYGGGANANDPVRAADVATAETPAFDIKPWTRKVGEMEVDANGVYTNPAPRTNLANLDMQDTGAGGHGTYYMAGLAYWANTNDIRLDKPIRVQTFAIDVDEGGNGLIDGNTRTIKPRDSQLYLAAKYGGFIDKNKDGNPFITLAADDKNGDKPPVTGSNAEWDNNGNGVPANYFLAGQPKELIKSIGNIFSKIGSPNSGTLSGVSASSTKVASDGAFVFQPGFYLSGWSGSLTRLKLSLDDETGAVKIAASADWDAGEVLSGTGGNAANPTPDARHIYTVNPDKLLQTMEFKWSQLSESQKALLNISPADKKDDGLGEKRLNYLRGVRDLELGQQDGVFRPRDRVLGDIINSNPTYVGAPALNVQGVGYQNFYDSTKERTKAVYVGANDGMLHAFRVSDGTELFAYVPNALFQNLNQLTLPEYKHRPFVDGAMSVAEARIASTWKTVLVSGMGGGAQGVFALDVTNPANFGAGSGALWEFTDSDDPDMGNLISAPIIAKFRTKVTGGVPEFKYFAVVASGLNNYANDGENKFDAAAPGTLFLLSLDKAPSEKWHEFGMEDGKKVGNYYKFKMPIKDVALQNGLSAPALVIGNDGAVRYAYAGDLQGNLWRLNFTGDAPWSTPDTPLFTATDAQGLRQPITVQPKVVFAPGGGYVVLFGTGKFVEDADAAAGNFKTQSFYAIHDTTADADKVVGRSQLAARTLTVSGNAVAVAGDEFTYGTAPENKKGWYVDFPDSDKTGERSVTNPLVVYGRLFFNSLILGSDPCKGGGGRTYSFDVLSGLPIGGAQTGYLSEVGMLSSPVLFEAGSAEVGDRNAIGKRVVKKKYSVFNFGTGGVKGMSAPAQKGAGEVALPAGRFSWREVLNWLELRAEAKKK